MKYVDKKDKDSVPDKVIDLLITFINVDFYDNDDIVDEVTLCILATNVGAKSVVDRALERLGMLKGGVRDIAPLEAGRVAAMIVMSGKVDKGLTEWLKKVLEKDDLALAHEMYRCREWEGVIRERPEVDIEVRRLLGLVDGPKEGIYRSL